MSPDTKSSLTNEKEIINDSLLNVGNPIDDLVDLRKKQNIWREGSFKTSNLELYNMLGESLDIYNRINSKPAMVNAFRSETERAGLRFKRTTSLINRIVRYVFGADSKRASGYARVLTRAHLDGIEPLRLPSWIAAAGGVEEIRAKQSGRVSPAERVAQNKLRGETEAKHLPVLQTVRVPDFALTDAASSYVTMLARVTSTGAIELLAPIVDERVVDAALASYGARLADKDKANAVEASVSAANDAVAAALA